MGKRQTGAESIGEMNRKFYITSPIYYVNDKPHVGHAYSTIIADALARYHRLLGDDVIFLTGTDENSQKTVDAAQKSGENILSYTDRLAGVWKSVWQALGISNTDFIRTTEARHKKTVEEFWKRIRDKGDIYKGEYEGLYCKGHEAFVKESDLADGLCPDHKTKPEHLAEENYFFKLKNYEKDLLDFYDKNPKFIVPENRYNEVKSFVREGLEDLSISRQSQKWGIPVPNDPGQVIYVWFDALINYVSGVGIDGWQKHPADVHVIGKDISRFHAIIWPAMLMSAGLPLPKQVAANGFFTVDGVKISKSLGNAIDPLELTEKYGVDALRYFLLREIPYGEDGDFSEEKLKERYNADLANGLGNFAARTVALGEGQGKIPFKDVRLSNAVDEKIRSVKAVVAEKMNEYKFNEVLTAVWQLIQFGDEYINEKKPWKKEGGEDTRVVYELGVILDNIAVMITPLLPETAEKITGSIDSSHPDEVFGPVMRFKKQPPLFPRK